MSIGTEYPATQTQRNLQDLGRELQEKTRAVKLMINKLGIRRSLSLDQKQRAADAFGAEAAFLSATKAIFNKKRAEIRAVTACISRATSAWKAYTIPYPERGLRLIKTDRIAFLEDELNEIRQELLGYVAELDAVLDDYKRDAQEKLGSLYNAADYPNTVIGAFDFAWEYPSIEPDRAMLDLHPEIYEREQERLRQRFAEAVELTEQALQSEFTKLIAHLTDRLTPKEDGTRKALSKSAVENINEFFTRLEEMPIRSSAELEAMVDQAKAIIGGVDVKAIKKDDHARQTLQESMAGLLGAMETQLTAVPRRAIDFDSLGDGEE